MRALSLLFVAALALPLGAEAEPLTGSFTAIAAPMPYPFWDDLGHRCNAGVEPVHKTGAPFTAPETGLLTLSAEGFIGDWDLFVLAENGTEIAASNRRQDPTASDGTERATTLLEADQTVTMMACNQTGAPVAEITWSFEAFDTSLIAATVGVGDDGPSNFYAPQDIVITTGDAIAWSVVQGTQPHTVTGEGDSFRGGTILDGTYARVFDEPGTYLYFCEFHGDPTLYPNMQTGRIEVVAG